MRSQWCQERIGNRSGGRQQWLSAVRQHRSKPLFRNIASKYSRGVPRTKSERADTPLRDLVTAFTARPGYTSAIGTRVIAVEPGSVELAVDRREDLLQFSGFFHGGVVVGLADHAAGGAVTTLLPSGRTAVTVDLHTSFVAPADGQVLVARARAVRVGATLSVASVEVTSANRSDSEDGRLCALCTVTLRTVSSAADARTHR